MSAGLWPAFILARGDLRVSVDGVQRAGDPKRTILVVEDDGDVRDALSGMLDELGYAVVCASDGVEALDYLRESHSQVRLILLDLMMPRMDGYQLRAEQLRDPALASIPVLVLSGDTNGHDPASGLHDVPRLEKPPRFIELVNAIEQLV